MTKATRVSIGAAALLSIVAGGTYRALAAPSYFGTRFSDVWDETLSTPYATLPQTRVTAASFATGSVKHLANAATRTISDKSDLLPRFDKLVHPNGICLAGTWSITAASPYTGYFSQGSRGLIIARASVALSDTKKGDYRGFGLSGKIYATEDPEHSEPLKTANFFVIDDLGGTMTEHYADAVMTNEPEVTTRWSTFFSLGSIAAAANSAFKAADINPGIRQVYPIAELALSERTPLNAPKFMKIQGAAGPRIDEADFRDELKVANYGGHLKFEVFVSEDKRRWQKLGLIDFTDSVASDSCDHRLHFAHPKYRTELD